MFTIRAGSIGLNFHFDSWFLGRAVNWSNILIFSPILEIDSEPKLVLIFPGEMPIIAWLYVSPFLIPNFHTEPPFEIH